MKCNTLQLGVYVDVREDMRSMYTFVHFTVKTWRSVLVYLHGCWFNDARTASGQTFRGKNSKYQQIKNKARRKKKAFNFVDGNKK